jgi:hypothetical protein
MPLPMIAGVCRCAIRSRTPGVLDEVINVIHVGGASAGDEATIDTILQTEWDTFASPALTANQQFLDVTYTVLDGSASVILPWTAGQPSDSSTALGMNTAVVASWRTSLAGRSHRGRSFLGALGHNSLDSTAPDRVNPTQVTNITTRGGVFIANMSTGTFPLVVASYKLSSARDVTRCVCNPKLCTQRKRVNGR